MCLDDAPVRNVDLYVWGGEGLNVCEECELLIVAYVRSVSGWHIRKNHEKRKTQQANSGGTRP